MNSQTWTRKLNSHATMLAYRFFGLFSTWWATSQGDSFPIFNCWKQRNACEHCPPSHLLFMFATSLRFFKGGHATKTSYSYTKRTRKCPPIIRVVIKVVPRTSESSISDLWLLSQVMHVAPTLLENRFRLCSQGHMWRDLWFCVYLYTRVVKTHV